MPNLGYVFLLQIIDMIHQRNAQVGGGCGVIKNSPPASSVFDRASSKQPQPPLCVGGVFSIEVHLYISSPQIGEGDKRMVFQKRCSLFSGCPVKR